MTVAAILLMLAMAPAAAQPPGNTAGDTYGGFERLSLDVENNGHRYRIGFARPLSPPPPGGYATLLMLDGNAVEEDLAQLRPIASEALAYKAPLIVTIGYETDQRFELAARAFDFTPLLTAGHEEFDPLDADRRTGGAESFSALLGKEILPALERVVPIDRQRMGLWGHSYGGLFVLNTLANAPSSFRCYMAASPSLWWRDGYFYKALPELREKLRGTPFSLLVTSGGKESEPPTTEQLTALRLRREQLRESVPLQAARLYADGLRDLPGAAVDFVEFPGRTHGQAFKASILPSLNWFSRCADGGQGQIPG